VALIAVHLEPIETFDAGTKDPAFWAVVTSGGRELHRYPGTAKALAETYVTEFNVRAFEVHMRLRDLESRMG
jgi:hypothetical protein